MKHQRSAFKALLEPMLIGPDVPTFVWNMRSPYVLRHNAQCEVL